METESEHVKPGEMGYGEGVVLLVAAEIIDVNQFNESKSKPKGVLNLITKMEMKFDFVNTRNGGD